MVVMNFAFLERSTGLLLSIWSIFLPNPEIIPAGLVMFLLSDFFGLLFNGFLSLENSKDSFKISFSTIGYEIKGLCLLTPLCLFRCSAWFATQL